MHYKRSITALLGSFSLLCPLVFVANANAPHRHKIVTDNQTIEYTPTQIAKALNWVTVPVSQQNVCGGYYQVPAIVANFEHPGNFKHEGTTITSKGPVVLHRDQQSAQLERNIVVTQPGRIIKADHGYLIRSSKTHKITEIELIGHVSLEEKDKHLTGTHGYLNLVNHYLLINHAIYHLYQAGSLNRLSSSGWGEAKKITRHTNNVFYLYKASYSTSAPTHPSWILHANNMKLNKGEGWGSATNMYLTFYHVPIFYSPYYSFPLDRRRKTGFLTPLFSHSSTNGFSFTLPYYLNLAPNYDDTIYLRHMAARGFQASNQFRYLTTHNTGQVYVSGIKNDPAFKNFKSTTVKNFPNTPTNQIFFNELKKDSNSRYFLSAENHGHYANNQVTTKLDLNYVSDAYYFQDFGSRNVNVDTASDQLLNQAEIQYHQKHWEFTTLGQIYQTLHPINMPNPEDQFRRLPEFDVAGSYPGITKHLDAGVTGQWVNFSFQSDFTQTIPTIGQRINAKPYLDFPFNWAAGYIHPEVALESTSYKNRNLNTALTKSQSRGIPITDVDAGLYFNRSFTFLKQHYRQTLQPELFYLYVPYQNQQQFPIYDTVNLPFSYSQLYATNSYTGFDRIQNANQLTIGASSSIYNEATGAQTLFLGAGVIDYFATPKVCLTTKNQTCIVTSQHFSPIAAEVTYYPWTHWSVTGTGAWSTAHHQVDNATAQLSYSSDNNHILSLGYTFTQGYQGQPDSKLLTSGLVWPLLNHWQIFNYIYYNVAKGYAQNFDAGLEYNTCGWAIRFVGEKTYNGISYNNPSSNQNNVFDRTYYVELLLKGLGGTSPLDSTFAAGLPGYKDPFGQNY